jgi:hypothetical protein
MKTNRSISRRPVETALESGFKPELEICSQAKPVNGPMVLARHGPEPFFDPFSFRFHGDADDDATAEL